MGSRGPMTTLADLDRLDDADLLDAVRASFGLVAFLVSVAGARPTARTIAALDVVLVERTAEERAQWGQDRFRSAARADGRHRAPIAYRRVWWA